MSEEQTALTYTLLLVLEYPQNKMFAVHGRQTAEPMHFGLDSTYSLSFAVDGTDEVPETHHFFLSFNSARGVNSMGAFLVILCAMVAPTFY